MKPNLRLHPGQQTLTPEQEAEAQRFAEARIAAQLSTAPVDEPETEQLLGHVYAGVGLPPPQQIHWVDGPLQFVAALAPHDVEVSMREDMESSILGSMLDSVSILGESVWESMMNSMRASVESSVLASVWNNVGGGVRASMVGRVWASALASVDASVKARGWVRGWVRVGASVRAYADAHWLAFYHFLAVYLAPNDLHTLAHFNEQVSGYWLGHEQAIIVRRPRVLSCDVAGRLHSATGTCMEYHDGWGFYAWHGVQVDAKVVLSPETLTREDFLIEPDLEVRHVIQERMGERFVQELCGVVLDTSPHGSLYEVHLPEDDPEGVARYVQVQDASTERQYMLRVPPTTQTAAEAVAWSFQMTVEEYRPGHET